MSEGPSSGAAPSGVRRWWMAAGLAVSAAIFASAGVIAAERLGLGRRASVALPQPVPDPPAITDRERRGVITAANLPATIEPATIERATIEPATIERATIEPATIERASLDTTADVSAPRSNDAALGAAGASRRSPRPLGVVRGVAGGEDGGPSDDSEALSSDAATIVAEPTAAAEPAAVVRPDASVSVEARGEAAVARDVDAVERAPELTVSPLSIDGSIDRLRVRAVLSEEALAPVLTPCAAGRAASSEQVLRTRLIIDPNGRVRDARVTGGAPAVEECVSRALSRLVFPLPNASDAIITFTARLRS